ncbi:rhodanese-like domain-containing protein [Paenibacillus lentus]|uniref:Rhodanese-like domain-containing protein n=1 Tax=Paenibacillus lentus TaxID=1338368 RepID=A0A3S8RPG1_9BACL|nr:rhodanese-like domain-containing protein [Paenibacillus lentus]AZK44874.1 rhodanese-like domain-containing protein [Paenibacillus lentus]
METSTLIYILIILLIVWFAYTRVRPAPGLRLLRDEQFRNEMQSSKDCVVIDVRETGEYKRGHIPGAKNIPLSQLQGRISEIPQDMELLLYCQSGMRSKNAARILSKSGYSKLAHLTGGISAWRGKITK